MTRRHQEGLTIGDVLIALAVLGLCAAILIPIFIRLRAQTDVGRDVSRMRKLYVGLSLYQEAHSGRSPFTLLGVDPYVLRGDFTSVADPLANAKGPFPVDPLLPNSRIRSTVRISDAYLGAYLTPPVDWQRLEKEQSLAILGNPWHGRYVPRNPPAFDVYGPVIRIRLDGALAQDQPDRSSTPLKGIDDLFRIR